MPKYVPRSLPGANYINHDGKEDEGLMMKSMQRCQDIYEMPLYYTLVADKGAEDDILAPCEVGAKIYRTCQGVIVVHPHIGTFGDEC